MTVTSQNLRVRRGDSIAVTIAITQADGSPYDPTIGSVIRYRMARTWHTPEADVLIAKELGGFFGEVGVSGAGVGRCVISRGSGSATVPVDTRSALCRNGPICRPR